MARRYLVRDLRRAGGSVELPRDVAHHVGKVMRMQAGDRIVLFDGAGFEAEGRLVTGGDATARLEVALDQAPIASSREPSVTVELGFGVPKGPRADRLFEHACEIGVRRFRPLHTARTEQIGKPAGIARKLARWRRIVEAAAGQCDRAWLPTVDEPVNLDRLLHDADLPPRRFVAAGDSATPLAPAPAGAKVLLIVGPEGGLTSVELAQLVDARFERVSLGPLTLRVETAALVGIARLLA